MHLLRDDLQLQVFIGKSLAEIQVGLSEVFSRILGVEYARVRTLMGGVHDWSHMPQAEGVVGVYAGGQPHLLHVNAAGTVTDHARGFATAGTGASFAEHAITAFRQVRGIDLNLHQAKMLVFRVVQDAIAAAGGATAIGGAVQMGTISLAAGTPVTALLGWDDPAIKDAVDNWMADEADRFRQHQPPGP